MSLDLQLALYNNSTIEWKISFFSPERDAAMVDEVRGRGSMMFETRAR